MHTRPLTTSEAAQLGTSRETARRLAANGELDGEKAGDRWLISAESVTARGLAGNAIRELAKAEAEIARWEAFLADHPGNEGAKRLLGWEREHAGRVRSFLRSCGVRP